MFVNDHSREDSGTDGTSGRSHWWHVIPEASLAADQTTDMTSWLLTPDLPWIKTVITELEKNFSLRWKYMNSQWDGGSSTSNVSSLKSGLFFFLQIFLWESNWTKSLVLYTLYIYSFLQLYLFGLCVMSRLHHQVKVLTEFRSSSRSCFTVSHCFFEM